MPKRVWTISNAMSVSRLLLLAPLAYCLFGDFEGHRFFAAGFIAIATVTDFLDGYLARRFHEVSEVGKIVDPLADKIAVGTLAVFLLILGDIPLWYVIAVLVRDVMILAGGIYIRSKKSIVTQSNWPGKIAVSLIAFYLFLSTILVESLEGLRTASLWMSVAMMVLSLGIYMQRLFIGSNVGRGS